MLNFHKQLRFRHSRSRTSDTKLKPSSVPNVNRSGKLYHIDEAYPQFVGPDVPNVNRSGKLYHVSRRRKSPASRLSPERQPLGQALSRCRGGDSRTSTVRTGSITFQRVTAMRSIVPNVNRPGRLHHNAFHDPKDPSVAVPNVNRPGGLHHRLQQFRTLLTQAPPRRSTPRMHDAARRPERQPSEQAPPPGAVVVVSERSSLSRTSTVRAGSTTGFPPIVATHYRQSRTSTVRAGSTTRSRRLGSDM